VPIHWLGPDGRILHANQAELNLLGYARADYVGRPIAAFHAEARAADEMLRRLWGEGGLNDFEARLRCKDGSIKQVLIDAGAVRERGQVIAARAVTRDISALRQAEALLHDSEERFWALFEFAPIAIALHGKDGKYLRTNRAYQTMLGYTDSELRILGVKGVTHPHDVTEGRALYRELLEGKRDLYQREKRYCRKDGSLVWARSTAAAVRGPDKDLSWIISMVEDVTERKKLAEEILGIAERERGRLGQDLHDGLCQNLIGLRFKSELLEKKLRVRSVPEAAAAAAIVALLNQAIQEAHDLALGLNPVRLEANGLEWSLRELAASTEGIFNIACRCRLRSPTSIVAPSAAVHLYRIAQEAISNAIKHGKASRVSVGFARRKGRAVLWVKDNGVGFPLEGQTKTGMGLHSMRHRARMIGAALEWRRNVRGGTKVVCVLPEIRSRSETEGL
jgi:PAS domain S-box-containing protein